MFDMSHSLVRDGSFIRLKSFVRACDIHIYIIMQTVCLLCICVRMGVCICVYIYIYICMYVCMYVYVYMHPLFIYVCLYARGGLREEPAGGHAAQDGEHIYVSI